jgi:hypothetical protein
MIQVPNQHNVFHETHFQYNIKFQIHETNIYHSLL